MGVYDLMSDVKDLQAVLEYSDVFLQHFLMESIRKVSQLNIWALVLIYIVNYVVSRPVIDSTLRPLHCEDIIDPVSKELCLNSSGIPFHSPSLHSNPEPSNLALSRVPRTALKRDGMYQYFYIVV